MSIEIKEICELKAVLSQVSRLEDRIMEETSLTLNEALALCTLSKLCLGPGDLAPELRVSPSRATRISQNLMKKGFVLSREGVNADGRRKTLGLSPAGEALAQRLHRLQEELFPFALTKEV